MDCSDTGLGPSTMKPCNKDELQELQTYWKNNFRLLGLQMLVKEKYESNLQLLFQWIKTGAVLRNYLHEVFWFVLMM